MMGILLGRWVVMNGKPSFLPTLELCQQVQREQEFQRQGERTGNGNIPRDILNQILSEESERSGVSIVAILGKARTQRVYHVRQKCYVRLRELHFSLAAIGLAMHKDHTTVLHGLQCVEKKENKSKEPVE